jgi:tRNA threonylcarbamoyladenosine biosynthesis protein TsaB
MWCLGIETSGRRGSIALTRGGECVAEQAFAPGPRHGRDLLPTIAELAERAGLRHEDRAVVGVSAGPGSFTGLRIGVACAKALAWALGWDLVGVESLDVMAANAPAEAGCVCPVLDARRRWVYGRLYDCEDGAWRPRTPVLAGRPEELAAQVPEGTTVFGDGVRAYPEILASPPYRLGPEDWMTGRAREVARLAMKLHAAGRRDDPLRLVPRYYRITEAEENLARRAAR